jgi:hypothetical protein
MRVRLLLSLLAPILACVGQQGSGGETSDIKTDETVVFFPTYGHRESDGSALILDIHGWVFEPEQRRMTLALLRRLVGDELAESAVATTLFAERARLFLADNERGKQVVIRVGEQTFGLDESGANGHFAGRVRLCLEPVTSVAANANPADRALRFEAVLPKHDARAFAGVVHILEPTGVSVVSDIDDTIKVSNVNQKRELLRNTFLRPFQEVAGMAEVYQHWREEVGAAFHYVSASPWQLYPVLNGFLGSEGFPPGSVHLKSFRAKDETFLNLFASPEQYKINSIEPLLLRFPKRRFVLVGDSTEKDPEAYAVLARRYPEQVVRILIRKAAGDARVAERCHQVFGDLPAGSWRLFEQPAEIRRAVTAP